MVWFGLRTYRRATRTRHGQPMKTASCARRIADPGRSVASATPRREDAASYPSRTVRLIVPAAPGGPIDAVARIMADAFRGAWPVPVVVENKPGAGTSTGGIFVAQSAPDGYTLLVNPDSIAVNPSLYPNLRLRSDQELRAGVAADDGDAGAGGAARSRRHRSQELHRARQEQGRRPQHRVGRRRHDQPSHRRAAGAARRLQDHARAVPRRGARALGDARRPRRRHVGDAGAGGAASALRQAQGGRGDGRAARSRIAGGADRRANPASAIFRSRTGRRCSRRPARRSRSSTRSRAPWSRC